MAATSYTKGQIVEMALGDLGIASYVFDTEAEEDRAALRKLDALGAEWSAKMEGFGYVQPVLSGESLPSDLPGIDESMVSALQTNLALRIAPSYGKTPSPDLRGAAREGRGLAFSTYAKSVTLEMPSRMPMGAGQRRFRRTYFPLATAEE